MVYLLFSRWVENCIRIKAMGKNIVGQVKRRNPHLSENLPGSRTPVDLQLLEMFALQYIARNVTVTLFTPRHASLSMLHGLPTNAIQENIEINGLSPLEFG